ncbi:MAG: EAL domain-containing protein [Phycisphaerales bacterium]|nr:EAL domain-containing protein [Phycisphaerales bacterium]
MHGPREPYRVLVIDRDRARRERVRSAVVAAGPGPVPPRRGDRRRHLTQPRFEVDGAIDVREGVRLVREALLGGRPYAIVFVDGCGSASTDGSDAIERLWRLDAELQIVLCDDRADGPRAAVTARVGASDRLLLLPSLGDELEVRQLARVLSAKWSVTRTARTYLDELEAAVEARTEDLRRAATHDKLTGLPNRTLLDERLAACLARASKDPAPTFALLFLDCDRFKSINDSLGHEVGDRLLIAIADRLYHGSIEWSGRQVPTLDVFCCRLSGDEFVVLLEGAVCLDAVRAFATTLMEDLASPYCLNGHEVLASASIGIAMGHARYEHPEDVVRDADAAMYAAKGRGTSDPVVFDHTMQETTTRRLALEQDLRRAVERREMSQHYQPIISLESGLLVGFESLLRWHHPERGRVSPVESLALAEDLGLIHELSAWSIHDALSRLATWSSEPVRPPYLFMSINISRTQMRVLDVAAVVGGAIDATGVDPKAVVLEVSETTIMDDPVRSDRMLTDLRERGVRVFVDDFGTGYSSLSCLQQFGLDGLKVDRSFVATVSHRRDYAAIVHAVVTLAHNLGMQLVAEGIETRQQLSMLQGLGCDHGQGFYIARPIAADGAAAMIRNWADLGRSIRRRAA